MDGFPFLFGVIGVLGIIFGSGFVAASVEGAVWMKGVLVGATTLLLGLVAWATMCALLQPVPPA